MTDWNTMTARERDAWIAEHVMGESVRATTDELICRAVMNGMRSSDGRGNADFHWNGRDYRKVRLAWSEMSTDTNWRYGGGIWLSRDRQEWQSDIEAHVSSWTRDDIRSYTTDAGSDYLVLERVRETWTFSERSRFANVLDRILRTKLGTSEAWPDRMLRYDPGVYSRAAHEALTAAAIASPPPAATINGVQGAVADDIAAAP